MLIKEIFYKANGVYKMVFHRTYAFNQSDYYKKLKELYNEDYVIVKVFFPENHFNAYEIIYRFRTTLDN